MNICEKFTNNSKPKKNEVEILLLKFKEDELHR